MKGTTGDEDLPIISVLMNALSALADLAHEDYRWRIQGYNVPNLPDFTDVIIKIQPAAPFTDLEVRFAIFGIYYIVYDMVKKRKFKVSDYNLYWADVAVGRVTISNRVRPTVAKRDEFNFAQASTNQTRFFSNESQADPLLQTFFEYLSKPEVGKLPAPTVFVTLLAALKNLAIFPETDVVRPFSTGALGFTIRLNILEMEHPRTEPPFFLYGNLIDTIKKIPTFMLDNRKFAEIFIVIMSEDLFIGEGTIQKGIP